MVLITITAFYFVLFLIWVTHKILELVYGKNILYILGLPSLYSWGSLVNTKCCMNRDGECCFYGIIMTESSNLRMTNRFVSFKKSFSKLQVKTREIRKLLFSDNSPNNQHNSKIRRNLCVLGVIIMCTGVFYPTSQKQSDESLFVEI